MTSQVSPSTVAAAPAAMEDKAEDGPNGPDPNRWFFEKESLETTPSRKCGIDADKELYYRQQSANFIQDMGQRLQVNQLCINTAIVYMHRFYMYHSFTHFHRNHVSTASIFLAAKVEEQPRKLEHVIKVAHYCLNRDSPPIDTKSENYAEQTSELVMTENILLQTLGFDINIDHPHTHVVKCCQLVRASKDLAQTSYFMATNSLHLTTMCLQYKPTVVACVCIHLTCKWSNWEIPRSKEGRDWFWYVDDTVTMEQLEKLTTEFLAIFDKSPSRLKKKINSLTQASGGGSSLALGAFPTLGLDCSPGAPPSIRSQSPATQQGTPSLKRPAIKPPGGQVNNKQQKVNGGIGHHPIKPPHGAQGPATNSSAKHPPHFPGSKGAPPGSHHGAKDTHNMQHLKAQGHHHANHPPQAYPHGSSNRPSSSHSHPSGFHSQSHAPPSGQPKPPSSSHTMSGQQHPLKPPHSQPSKVPYNYNSKSQPLAAGPPQAKPISTGSASQPAPASSVNKGHPPQQPPAVNQVKKPYLDNNAPRRESPADFNGKRESSDEAGRRSSNLNSQPSTRPRLADSKPVDVYSAGVSTSNLPAVSLPFNATTTSEPSRMWGDSNTGETRIPPVRTSLFSPDPELIESTNFLSSSIQSIVQAELSPIGDVGVDIGAKDGSSSDNPFMPSSVSAFPNLFEYGIGGRSFSDTNNTGNSNLKPDGVSAPPDEIKAEAPSILPTTTTASVPVTSSLADTGLSTKPQVTSPSSRVADSLDGEPPHKKVKKNKKEKHKHKDKDKDRHDEKKDRKEKDEKKHKDRSKEKNRDDKKHKEKHKKEKHKEKERDKSKAKPEGSSPPPPPPPSYGEMAGTKTIKILNIGSRMLETPVAVEKQKSKHSSTKKHSSKTNLASESSSTPSIRLKIALPRPPTGEKPSFTSKQN